MRKSSESELHQELVDLIYQNELALEANVDPADRNSSSYSYGHLVRAFESDHPGFKADMGRIGRALEYRRTEARLQSGYRYLPGSRPLGW
jgi:hypothetical protein